MNEARKRAQALAEIRRRVETATNDRERVELLVLQRVVETGASLDPLGKVTDVVGDVYTYCLAIANVSPKVVEDLLAYIVVAPLAGREEAFSRYAEGANDTLKLDKRQQKACLDLVYAYLGIGC